MSQILLPPWWFAFADQIWPWWLACAVLGLLALPLSLRAFRALADGGAGLSIGVGVCLTTWMAWTAAHVGASHTRATIRAAAVVLAVSSIAVWWRHPRRLRRALRANLVPFLAAQLLFAVGFLYFCNVRSFVPWATFDIGLSGAEKAGNLMHLNSAMRATAMPPGDAWFLGEPTNYYYGGHLLVATLAKLTGTPARFAFNYGLATIFGLSLSMGFSLTYSMVVRRGPHAGRGVPWHRGMAWGVLGGLAIALFGNLDAWRQLGRRAVDNRWSLENLKQIDYWASSRAILGAPPGVQEPCTITEFPYFSAMLGDLHPHHMALPYTIAALAACLALLRRNPRPRPTTEREWLARSAGPAAAMALAIGLVFPVNIWDTIVLSVAYLLVVAVSRRGVAAADGWRWLLYPALAVGVSASIALVVNVWAHVPAFGTPLAYLLALVVTVAGARAPLLAMAGAALVAAVGGVVTAFGVADVRVVDALAAGVRDGAIAALAAAVAFAVVPRSGRRAAAALGVAGAYAGIGVLALVMASPFLSTFRSPLGAQAPLFAQVVPPVLSSAIVSGTGPLVQRLWSASPVNPFPAELRSTLPDFLAHWGLFVLPLLFFVLQQWVKAASRRPRAGPLLAGFAVATSAGTLFAMQGYWVGPLALALALLCGGLALLPRTRLDAPTFVFAATGFFWCWFVEALHFDDSYGGNLERYNTPFKIFYPLWPMFVAAALGALRRLSPRISRCKLPLLCVLFSSGVLAMGVIVAGIGWYTLGRRHGSIAAGIAFGAAVGVGTAVQVARYVLGRRIPTTDAPALAAGLLLAMLGLLYPFAATAVRTRSFFSEPLAFWMVGPDAERVPEFYTRRTLDGLAWLGQTKRFVDDLPAIEWLIANGTAGSVVLEAPSGGAYTPEGRVASMTGLPTLIGWKHHENQWRGWARPLPVHLQTRFFDELAPQLPDFDLGVGLPREGRLALYRASLDSPPALLEQLRTYLPAASQAMLERHAATVIDARQRTFSAAALAEKLHQRMGDLWRARSVDEDVRRLLRLYRVRYVFAGTLERDTFGPTARTFAAFPRVFASGKTEIYEVPAEVRNMPAR